MKPPFSEMRRETEPVEYRQFYFSFLSAPCGKKSEKNIIKLSMESESFSNLAHRFNVDVNFRGKQSYENPAFEDIRMSMKSWYYLTVFF